MKKTILAALFVFVLIFSAHSEAAQVILPEPVAKPFVYQIRRGDNLTKLARIFGTTVKELLAANGGNPNIKNKDLILAGGLLNISGVYLEKDIAPSFNLYQRLARERGIRLIDAKWRNSQNNILIGALTIVCIVLLILCLTLPGEFKKKKEKLLEENHSLQVELKHLNIQLSLAHEQLKLKEGAEEEIRRQKQENDRLVERVSRLYTDNDAISVNLAETHSRLEEMEKLVKFIPGHAIELQSQERGKIWLSISKLEKSREKDDEIDVFVECPKRDCLANVARSLKARNALSHMAHSNHWPEK